jgi:glycerophosphoryl diester phosphodiesterase
VLRLLGRDAVHPEAGQLTEADVRRWHARGREVAVWTVDDPDLARRLRAWGVDSCITNRPGALRAALGAERETEP